MARQPSTLGGWQRRAERAEQRLAEIGATDIGVNLRDANTEIERLKADAQRLTEERDEANRARAFTAEELEKGHQQLRGLKAQNDALKSQRDMAINGQGVLNDAFGRIVEALGVSGKIVDVRGNRIDGTFESTLTQVLNTLGALQTRADLCTTRTGELVDAENKLTDLRERLRESEKESEGRLERLAAKNREIDGLQKALSQANRDYESAENARDQWRDRAHRLQGWSEAVLAQAYPPAPRLPDERPF